MSRFGGTVEGKSVSVMSPAQSRSGSSAVKSRLTKSGAVGRFLGLVSLLQPLTTRATNPSSAISFASVFTEIRQPLRTGRMKIFGDP